MRPLAGLLLLSVALSGCALDRDVRRAATAFEQQLGVRSRRLPVIARAAARLVAQGEVADGLVTFDELPAGELHLEALDRALGEALGTEWTQLLRSSSKATRELSLIYVRAPDDGEQLELFIASVQPTEAVLMKVRVSPAQLKGWLDDSKLRTSVETLGAPSSSGVNLRVTRVAAAPGRTSRPRGAASEW